jgi:hypothetical protein
MDPTRRILISRRLFIPDEDLVLALRAIRETRGFDEIAVRYDAFVLDGGLGPPTYLSADGRLIWDDDIWGVRGTFGEALAAVVAGSRKNALPTLRVLLPSRDEAAFDCAECDATGQVDAHGQMRDVEGRRLSVVCPLFGGLGWQSAKISLCASVLEFSLTAPDGI